MTEPEQPAGASTTRVVPYDVTARDVGDAAGGDDTESQLCAPNDAIGRYRLCKVLGRGGMGVVYEAHDPVLDRRIAIKLVRSARLVAGVDASQRLVREAQAIAQLSHPNVVEVYEVGREGAQVYIAMELVEGTSLRRWLQARPRARGEVLAVLRQAGAGLAAAHRAGIVHRDFKPDNIMVSANRRVRVLDFGLARPGEPTSGGASAALGSTDDRLTQTGTAMGTPAYMAPEQFVGGEVDPRTDQFAFCIVAVEALSGRRPFEGKSIEELARRTSTTHMDALAWRSVPRGLARVLRRGLSADREKRWPDMDRLLAALARNDRRWLVVAAGTIPLAAAVTAVVVGKAPARCPTEVELRTRSWDEPTRDRVRAAILDTQTPRAAAAWEEVEAQLALRVDRWADAAAAACRAVGPGAPGLRDCVEQRALEIDAAIEALAGTDRTTVHNVTRVVAGLPDISLCLEQSLTSTAPSPTLLDARARLAAALALEALGRYPAALAELDAAPSLGDEPDPDGVGAQLQSVRGRIARGAGDGLAAAAAFERAYFAALDAGRDDLAVLAAAELAAEGAVGYRDRWQWAGHAKAGLARAGGRDTAAAYDRAMCTLQRDSGALADAVEHCTRALAEAERTETIAIDERIAALRALADVRMAGDDLVSARDLYADALSAIEHARGAEHPSVADALDDLGRAELRLGNRAAARALGERALALRDRIGEQDDPLRAHTWSLLARVDLAENDFERARAGFARSLALQRRILGDSHPDTAASWHMLALAQEELGEKPAALVAMAQAAAIEEQLHPLDIARIPTLRELARMAFMFGAGPTAGREHLERAWQIVRSSGVPETHPLVKDLDHGYGETLLALGRAKEALPYLERFVDDPRPSDIHSHVAFVLGRALWAVGEHERAREVVERAAAAWARPQNDFQREQLATMQHWLSSDAVRDEWDESRLFWKR